MGKRRGTHIKLSAEEAKAKVDRLEPDLKRRQWAQMTAMLIPSMLEAASRLSKQMRYQLYKDRSNTELQVQLDRLTALREEFNRGRETRRRAR